MRCSTVQQYSMPPEELSQRHQQHNAAHGAEEHNEFVPNDSLLSSTSAPSMMRGDHNNSNNEDEDDEDSDHDLEAVLALVAASSFEANVVTTTTATTTMMAARKLYGPMGKYNWMEIINFYMSHSYNLQLLYIVTIYRKFIVYCRIFPANLPWILPISRPSGEKK